MKRRKKKKKKKRLEQEEQGKRATLREKNGEIKSEKRVVARGIEGRAKRRECERGRRRDCS